VKILPKGRIFTVSWTKNTEIADESAGFHRSFFALFLGKDEIKPLFLKVPSVTPENSSPLEETRRRSACESSVTPENSPPLEG
jgi:hypothetical protein